MVKEILATVDIKPDRLSFPEIPTFQYQRTLQQEVKDKKINRIICLELLELYRSHTFWTLVCFQ
jgi:hypothetical protein